MPMEATLLAMHLIYTQREEAGCLCEEAGCLCEEAMLLLLENT